MSNLSNNIQNIESSRSSIEGADFAAEAAYLAKNQILEAISDSDASSSLSYLAERLGAFKISLLLRI
jgi:flagellin-like hook-associated protein FlgL|tara:strand:- start:670 stop:870 length:201 start_codon:yes stop_codon:yes gene_type:complete